MVMNIIQNYKVNASSSREEQLQEAWDYVQAQVRRSGGDTPWHICSLVSGCLQLACVVLPLADRAWVLLAPKHSFGDISGVHSADSCLLALERWSLPGAGKN